MKLEKKICPMTGKLETLVFSNNPIVPPVSIKYIEQTLDLQNLSDADFFCRTYNIPFNPNYWIKSIQAENGKNIIQNYTKIFLEINKENLYYQTATEDLWRKTDQEWQRSLTHGQLLAKIEPVKEDFIERATITWGAGFTFEEYIKMESQYHDTVSSFDINNPMQIDAIKKANITGVMIDRAIIDKDIRGLKDLTSAYSSFMKMAKIEELIESSQSDVLRTVADLAEYLEMKGFEFEFYDRVERDIVDKTIEDLQEYLRTLVLESTGLDATLNLITDRYKEEQKKDAAEKAYEELPLEEIARLAQEELSREIDEELEQEEILQEDDLAYGDELEYDEENF